jgi:hypothetical protein
MSTLIRTMAAILADAYALLSVDGRTVTRAEIRRDTSRLFRYNFEQWLPHEHSRASTSI